MLELGIVITNGTLFIKVIGSFTNQNREDFYGVYDIVPNVDSIVVDFTQTTYIDSAALGMLLILKDRAKGKNVVLSGMTGNVAKIIEIAHLSKLFIVTR